MEDKRFTELQIEALVHYYYIQSYDKFEKLIINEFKNSFNSLDIELKQRIYFYLGGIGNLETFIEYDTYSTVSRSNQYHDPKLLNKLTFNQIIRIDKKENVINKFKLQIQSLTKRTIIYPFHDCCLKLLRMRNTLAHELNKFTPQDNNTIELLPAKVLYESFEPWLSSFDVNTMNDQSKAIYSNYIMMKLIHTKVEEKES